MPVVTVIAIIAVGGSVTIMRLIDADALLGRLADSTESWARNIQAICNWWPHAVGIKDNIVRLINESPTVDAVELDKFNVRLHHILIDNEGVPEVKLQIGDRYFILRTDPVDVGEVVRCKDCKYCERDHTLDGGGDEYYYCWHVVMEHGQARPNEFCCYGERKDND